MTEQKNNIGKLNAAIYRNLQGILDIKLQDIPIRGGQHDFLYVISNTEGITQKELSEILFVDKSTTAKAVNSLVTQGFIKKQTGKNDKRLRKLYLTEKGHLIKPTIQETFYDLLNITRGGLSDEETEQAIVLLQSILSSVVKEKIRLSKG